VAAPGGDSGGTEATESRAPEREPQAVATGPRMRRKRVAVRRDIDERRNHPSC
jgi:hypothetical protein